MPSVTIKDVDWMEAKNQENSKTAEFSHPDYVVVRRGRTIKFSVTMSSGDFNAQAVQLELQRGKDPDYGNKNKFLGTCTTGPRKHYEWKMKGEKVENTVADYELQVPFNTPVGDYSGTVRIPGGTLPESPACTTKKFVFIFNPYDSGDTVYMDDDSMRREYVEKKTGVIYKDKLQDIDWNYDQFDDEALNTVLYLMNHWDLTPDDRSNSAMVGRLVAALVNSVTGYYDGLKGIIEGNWSGEYNPPAENPENWRDSKKILDKYMKTKQPVKFGQCWVFAGVLTTILRTLGIPARPITCQEFIADQKPSSDHIFATYLDEDAIEIENPYRDDRSPQSFWPFHVWTEGWMTRPDLKSEGNYDGWQVLDGSPLYRSEIEYRMNDGQRIDLYCVGPASVQAIKNGLGLKYDTEFVTNGVNSVKVTYQKQSNGKFELLQPLNKKKTNPVGKYISTKKVGIKERENVALTYKYPEGIQPYSADLDGGEAPPADQSVQFSVKFNKEVYNIGDTIAMEVTSTAKKALKSGPVSVTVVVNHVQYTSKQMKKIKDPQKELFASGPVAVGSTASATFQVKPDEYLPDLGMDRLVQFTVSCLVESPKQSFVQVELKSLHVPDLAIQINGKATSDEQAVSLPANKPAKVVASFVNPLKTAMTNIKFHVEGSGLLSPQTFNAGTVAAGAKASVPFQITPEVRGQKKEAFLVINAESDKIKGITGAVDILIV